MSVLVTSQSDSTVQYEVDLVQGTCTCPAFVYSHGRVCKHMLMVAKWLGVTLADRKPNPKPNPEPLPKEPAVSEWPKFEPTPAVRQVNSELGKKVYYTLDKLARVRLSPHFILRDFLFCANASMQGICNYPSDDPELVIRSGKLLCKQVLEPILAHWGPFAITYGYENRWSMEGGWSDAEKAKKTTSSNPHQWDRGTFGKEVYARVDIQPWCVEDGKVTKQEFGHWLMHNLDLCLLMQWRKSNVFCITISPKPRRVWLEWVPQGKGEKGSNRITFMGEAYWANWSSLPDSERPKFGPSATGGRMWW